MAKNPDLDVTIQRRIIGERHDLSTLSGFWIKPKKYSTEGGEEITALRFKIAKNSRNPIVIKKLKKLRDEGIEVLDVNTLLDKLPEEEVLELLSATYENAGDNRGEMQKLQLLHGIGDHNFNSGGKKLAIEEAVPKLMQDAEAVAEILTIVEEWNIPLPQGRSQSSETQQNGSTSE